MVEVIGGDLYQWETGRKFKISLPVGIVISGINIANQWDSVACLIIPYEESGEIVAKIPNIYLQTSEDIVVYLLVNMDDGVNVFDEVILPVKARAKPDDYVYTEEEILSWHKLEERVEKLEKNGGANIDLTDYVKKTDYATTQEAGVIMIGNGFRKDSNNKLSLNGATEAQVKAKATNQYAITPAMIDVSVKEGLVNNNLQWTEEEKRSARDLLGITDLFNDYVTDVASLIGGIEK